MGDVQVTRFPQSLAVAAFATILSSLPGHSRAAPQSWIAGVKPDQRPAAAPMITEVDKDVTWYERALHGLEPPYPSSFSFLEYQGHWHTPFTRPGMTGRYDIRAWHPELNHR